MRSTYLGSVCEIEMGQAPKGSSYNDAGDGYPLLAGAGDFGVDLPAPSKFTTEPTKISKPGDILLCIRATIGDLNWSDREYCLGRGVAGLRPKNGQLDRKYLWRWLSFARPELEKRARGSTFKQVSRKDISDLEILLPSNIDEQCRIAAILDKADSVRCKREHTLAMANELLKSVFLEMFGDPVNNPKAFHIDAIGGHLNKTRPGTQSGPFGSALKKREYVAGGIPVWGVDNVQQNRFVPHAKLFITDEKYQQLHRYNVHPGDVLISRAGTVGRMCIAEPTVEKSIISTNLVRVVLDAESLLPEYFVSLFTYLPHRLGALKANNKDSAFTFLNPKTLKALRIPIPPVGLQEEYRSITQKIGDQVIAAARQLDGFSDLLAALSQRAFRGEL
jgi:type I restriction enzyme, S subunit